MLSFRCRCGNSLKVDRTAIGQSGHCPYCDAAIRLVAPRFHTPDDTFTHWLIVAQGPVRQGEQILLGGPGPIEIGKAARKPVFLPGKLVSRSHARLMRTKYSWRIEDESSTNGISINGEKSAGHELADGDIIQIGE